MASVERRERMRTLVARWQRSGQSGAAFCRRHGINPQKLSYWKRALGLAEPPVRRRRAAKPVGFVPVRLVDSPVGSTTTGGLEIALASGDRLMVGQGVSRELLRDAIQLLRERC